MTTPTPPPKAGTRILRSVRNAQVYARGQVTDGFVVHVPDPLPTPPAMSGDRIRELLDALGWSQNQLAGWLGLAHHWKVKQWCNGQAVVPDNVAAWLEAAGGFLVDHPLPDGWVMKGNVA